jgi:hypothetical protein
MNKHKTKEKLNQINKNYFFFFFLKKIREEGKEKKKKSWYERKVKKDSL